MNCNSLSLMKIKHLLLIITIIFLNIGCASLPKESLDYGKQKLESNATLVNGFYNIKLSKNDFSQMNRLVEIINRHNEEWPDINPEYSYRLLLEVLDDKHIKLSLFENGLPTIETTVKYKIKDEHYLYLKNKNFKRHNIPFILGGYDYRKVRLAINNDGDLILDSVHYGIGSFLFIIWSGNPTMRYSSIYKE